MIYDSNFRPDLDELAKIQGVQPVKDAASLGAPIWDSDEELEEFLDEVYRAREVNYDTRY